MAYWDASAFFRHSFLFFFCLAFPLHTDAFCMVAYWLHSFTRQWFAERSRLSSHPEPSQKPWGQCKAKPRLVGFDSCRSLLAWPGCSKDFHCFLISRECEVIELFPEIWEALSPVKSFNTARNLFSVGFTLWTMLPLRMLWGGICTSHFEALIQNTLALVVHLSSIMCLLMQPQAFKPPYVRLNFGLRVTQGHLTDWSQPWEILPKCLAQAYSLIFLPQVLLMFPFAMLSKFYIFFGASSFQSFTLLCFS